MDRSSKQNIKKHIVAWNNSLDEVDLTDIYRAFHTQRNKIHILFQCTWNIFKDRPHDRTQNKPQQIQKIEIISSIFSDHKGLKLETNPKGKNPKHSKSWRLNTMVLNNEWVKNEIREEIKKFLEKNENELTCLLYTSDAADDSIRV